MQYNFSLDEFDHLTGQLYVVSNSKPAKRRRRKGWLFTSSIFIITGILCYLSEYVFFANYFLAFGIISLFFYPLYSGWRYKRHYRKYIREIFSNNFGKRITLEFTKDYILTNDEDGSESKISNSIIESIHELSRHFLIRLNAGQSLIIPISKIDEVDSLRNDLTNLAVKLDIEFKDSKDWKWK